MNFFNYIIYELEKILTHCSLNVSHYTLSCSIAAGAIFTDITFRPVCIIKHQVCCLVTESCKINDQYLLFFNACDFKTKTYKIKTLKNTAILFIDVFLVLLQLMKM